VGGWQPPVKPDGPEITSFTTPPHTAKPESVGHSELQNGSFDTAKARDEDATQKEKPSRSGKRDKETRLVYSDNETSPEEKRARLPRYAFNPPAVQA